MGIFHLIERKLRVSSCSSNSSSRTSFSSVEKHLTIENKKCCELQNQTQDQTEKKRLLKKMKIPQQFATCFLLVLEGCTVSSFSTTKVLSTHSMPLSSELLMTATDDSKADEAPDISVANDELVVPLSFEEMVRQSSSAMADAYAQGISRQMIRILLPRSADNDNLLQYFEDDADGSMSQIILAPPDETWQGGIMQLYRAASFACQEMLR